MFLVAACSEIAGLGPKRSLAAGPGAGGGAGSAGAGSGAGGTGNSGGTDAAAGGGGAAGSGAQGAGGSADGGGSGGADAAAGAGGTGGDAATDACGADLQNDDKNCGYCGHDCLGGGCSQGACQPVELTSTLRGGWDIAVSGGNVFWTNSSYSKVYWLQKGASAPSSWNFASKGAAVAGGYFYFAGYYDASIYQLPVGGTASPTEYVATAEAPATVAADASGVYFDQTSAVAVTDGQNVTTLASGVPTPTDLALDATDVYFTVSSAPEVYRIPKSGAADAGGPLYSVPGDATRAVAVDSQYLYFATWDKNGAPIASAVYRAKKDGSAKQPIASGEPGTFDMVRAGPWLYWTNQGTSPGSYKDGSVVRARVDGAVPGKSQQVAAGQERPHGIAVDNRGVYWVNIGPDQGQTSVWRVAW